MRNRSSSFRCSASRPLPNCPLCALPTVHLGCRSTFAHWRRCLPTPLAAPGSADTCPLKNWRRAFCDSATSQTTVAACNLAVSCSLIHFAILNTTPPWSPSVLAFTQAHSSHRPARLIVSCPTPDAALCNEPDAIVVLSKPNLESDIRESLRRSVTFRPLSHTLLEPCRWQTPISQECRSSIRSFLRLLDFPASLKHLRYGFGCPLARQLRPLGLASGRYAWHSLRTSS
jgi:hypothetical protein